MINYLIKLAAEITIKSPWVRTRTIDLLKKNIRLTLTNEWFTFNIKSSWDSITLEINNDFDKQKLIWVLKNIFWISHILEVKKLEFESKEEIKELVLDYYKQKVSNNSFFVRVKRVWKHDFSSTELEKYIGWEILKNTNNARVTSKNPDYFIKLEIKDKQLNLVINSYVWSNWYPIWFTWKVLSLISWWFDSSVSTYMSMKRWLTCLWKDDWR